MPTEGEMNNKRICSRLTALTFRNGEGLTAFAEVSRVSGKQIRLLNIGTERDAA